MQEQNASVDWQLQHMRVDNNITTKSLLQHHIPSILSIVSYHDTGGGGYQIFYVISLEKIGQNLSQSLCELI